MGSAPFETADYRRSWLFFDDVDYVFPAELAGPITMPDLDAQEDCAVRRPELTPDELRELLERTRRDCADGLTRRFVAERVPERDRDYAAGRWRSSAGALGQHKRVLRTTPWRIKWRRPGEESRHTCNSHRSIPDARSLS